MKLYLAGFRGAGKSTVGQIVATRLDLPFLDLDQAVVQEAGMTIAAIFSRVGEAEFRQLESAQLRAAAAGPAKVVALGGGACISAENRDCIRSTGRCVWLTAPAEVLVSRIRSDPASGSTRPALAGLDLEDEVETLLAARRAGYAECAGWILDCSTLHPDELAAQVCQWWTSGR